MYLDSVKVLIVDDEEIPRSFVSEIIADMGLEVFSASDVPQAMTMIRERSISLIISDLRMPGATGVDLLEWLRQEKQDIPFILMSGHRDEELIVAALNLGAQHFLKKPFLVNEMKEIVERKLGRAQFDRMEKESRERMEEELSLLRKDYRDQVVEKERLFIATMSSLAKAIDARDTYTFQHSSSVAHYACKIASVMMLSSEDIESVRVAGRLHDVGKIAVAEAILLKPGKLTNEEYRVIQEHPLSGAEILSPLPDMEKVIEAVRYHHERYDGKGYPEGLAGEDIPIYARILAVADAWDAMTSDRPYRKAMLQEEAVLIVEEERGRQFDPEIAHAFLSTI